MDVSAGLIDPDSFLSIAEIDPHIPFVADAAGSEEFFEGGWSRICFGQHPAADLAGEDAAGLDVGCSEELLYRMLERLLGQAGSCVSGEVDRSVTPS